MMSEKLYRPSVGMVVLNPKGKFFLAQRIVKKNQLLADTQNAWQFPQGGVDDDEDLYKASLRELYEETSIQSVQYLTEYPDKLRYDLPEKLRSTLWNGKYYGQEQKWYMFLFLGAESEINIHTRHPEFKRWIWAEPNEALQHVVPFKKHIYEQIIPYFVKHWRFICGL